MAHIYKDLLIALAEGKEIQARYLSQEHYMSWFDINTNDSALMQIARGSAHKGYEMEFRIKPRTHIVCGHEINAPEVNMPSVGKTYWRPGGDGEVDYFYMENDSTDKMYLNAGLMYLTEEDAQAHSNAWLNPKV